MSAITADKHLAAVLLSKATPLKTQYRTTPSPGPNELLVEVKCLASNPVDVFQRDLGFMIDIFPTVLGSDISGTVLSTGSSVPSSLFKPGTRVAAFATAWFMGGNPDYGAMQQRVVVPAAHAVPIPKSMDFKEASILPMSLYTAWAGYYQLGLTIKSSHTPSDRKAILVWGASSSIGSAAVQIGKILGLTVFATASEKHHTYIKALGASKVFDYNDENVVKNIVKAARDDGTPISLCYDAINDTWQPCLDVLKEFKDNGIAQMASAPPLTEETPKMDGVEVKFIQLPDYSPEGKDAFFSAVFNVWLKEKLETGEFVPSPMVRSLKGGLDSANDAIEEWKKGVSATKIVLPI